MLLYSSYKNMSRTSISAGIVSGCAALLCAKYNNLNIYSPADLTSHLIESGSENILYTDLYGNAHKFKIIDLYKLSSENIAPKLVISNTGRPVIDSVEKTIKLVYTIKNRGCSAANISTSITCDNGYDISYAYQSIPETKMSSLTESTNICNIIFNNTFPKNSNIKLIIHVTYNNDSCTSDKKLYSCDYSVPVNISNISDTIETNIPLKGITVSAPSI